MKIKSIELFRVQIPFKKPFKHSTNERSATDNIVLRVRLEDGTLGYGEGCPRAHVLIMLASKDRVVNNQEIIEKFYEPYPSPKDLVEFKSEHYLDFGPSRGAYHQTVLRWLKEN